MASVPPWRVLRGRADGPVAARPGIRALLRLPRRFLAAEASQWDPPLVQDNTFVEPTRSPRDGYHLSEDLADRAIRMVLDQRQAAPEKPFFCYLALGAAHGPHQVPAQWFEPYRGRFDHGWESERDATFGRQLAAGLVPSGTELTARPSWVRD